MTIDHRSASRSPARAVALCLCTLGGACGFSTPTIPSLSPLLNLDTALRETPRLGAEELLTEVSKTKEQCVRYSNTVSLKLEKGKDSLVKAKGITGIVTGALSGGTGLGATIVGFASDQKTATNVLALSAGGIGVIGAIVTAFIAPGANEISLLREDLTTIKHQLDALDALTRAPAWTDDKAAVSQIRQILPTLRGLCVSP